MTVKILFLIVASLIPAIHIFAAVFKKNIAEILTYVNLGLHIVMFFLLMMLKVSIEFLALVFMISLLVHLVSALISYKLRKKERDDG